MDKAGAHHVGRLGDGDRGARTHAPRSAFFASVTSGAIASDVGVMPMPIDADFLVDDHLLDDAARIVGDAAIIAHDDFDLAARRPCRRAAAHKA